MLKRFQSRRVLYAVVVFGVYLGLQLMRIDGPMFIYGGSYSRWTYRGWPREYFRESWTGYFGSSPPTPSEITVSYWAAAIDAAVGIAVVIASLLAYDIGKSRSVFKFQWFGLVLLIIGFWTWGAREFTIATLLSLILGAALVVDRGSSRQITLRQLLLVVLLISLGIRFGEVFLLLHLTELFSLVVICGSAVVGYRSGRSNVVSAAGNGFSS
jgi:hypothetical protein